MSLELLNPVVKPVSSVSVHVCTKDPVLFLFILCNILLYICTTSSLSIHLLMDIQVASSHLPGDQAIAPLVLSSCLVPHFLPTSPPSCFCLILLLMSILPCVPLSIPLWAEPTVGRLVLLLSPAWRLPGHLRGSMGWRGQSMEPSARRPDQACVSLSPRPP